MSSEKKIKILAVEDEVLHQEFFFRTLLAVCSNIDCKIAINYTQAMNFIETDFFDVFLVDLALKNSHKQGQDFIKDARKIFPETLIYIVTGVEYQGVLTAPDFDKEFNVKKWLRKPLSATAFCRIVNHDLGL